MVFVTRDLVREATSVHHRIGGFPFSGSAPFRVLFDVLTGALARLAVSLIWRNEPRGDCCAHAPRGVTAGDGGQAAGARALQGANVLGAKVLVKRE